MNIIEREGMRKFFIKVGLASICLYIFSACSSTSLGMKCTPSMVRAGYFCYNGISFGKNLSPLYKRGIVDGCRSGQGYFFKDYMAFNTIELYRRGWIIGRKKCRPQYDDVYMNQTKIQRDTPSSSFDDGLERPPQNRI